MLIGTCIGEFAVGDQEILVVTPRAGEPYSPVPYFSRLYRAASVEEALGFAAVYPRQVEEIAYRDTDGTMFLFLPGSFEEEPNDPNVEWGWGTQMGVYLAPGGKRWRVGGQYGTPECWPKISWPYTPGRPFLVCPRNRAPDIRVGSEPKTALCRVRFTRPRDQQAYCSVVLMVITSLELSLGEQANCSSRKSQFRLDVHFKT